MDRTRCGRRIVDGHAPHWRAETPRGNVTGPDEAMAGRAAADWHTATTSKLYRKRDMLITQQAPDGICKPCWQNLGCYGLKTWTSDPLEVLRTDLAAADRASRTMLAKELVALADLWGRSPSRVPRTPRIRGSTHRTREDEHVRKKMSM
jgi:hypothetical protein